jgi:hypothetical protein
MPRESVLAGGLVFIGPLLATIQSAASEPLALAVVDVANGLAAGWPTVARRVAGRVCWRLVAAWPVA